MTEQVLIVEDEPDLRDLLLRVFDSLDAEVKAVASAEEALGLLEAESFRLVLTDINLVGMRGDELAIIIRKKSPETKVFAMTGDLTQKERLGGIFETVFTKPFILSQVLAHVHYALHGAENLAICR